MAQQKNPIEIFADELIKQAEITLPEDELSAYKERLMKQIHERLGLVFLNALDKKGLEEYANLMKKNPTPKEVQEFLASHIDNYQEKAREALEGFAQDFFAALRK